MLSIRYKFDLSAFLKHFIQMDFNVYKCLYCVLRVLHVKLLFKRFSNDIYLAILSPSLSFSLFLFFASTECLLYSGTDNVHS